VQSDIVTDQRGSVQLNLQDPSRRHTSIVRAGSTYVKKQFSVPRDVDRLDVSFAAPERPVASPIRSIVIDPQGTYTAYSVSQGMATSGTLTYANPRQAPGRCISRRRKAATSTGR